MEYRDRSGNLITRTQWESLAATRYQTVMRSDLGTAQVITRWIGALDDEASAAFVTATHPVSPWGEPLEPTGLCGAASELEALRIHVAAVDAADAGQPAWVVVDDTAVLNLPTLRQLGRQASGRAAVTPLQRAS